MALYDRFILPALINCACGQRPFQLLREAMIPKAEGLVLELGFGSGLNLPFYDPAKVQRVFALEPALGMLSRARRAAEKSLMPVTVLAETAEGLSLGPASVDTLVVTFSLCTIPDGIAALTAARRALRPGGKLIFLEHGLAPDAQTARMQRRIEPIWRRIAGGCHLSRDIPALIRAGGFAIDELDSAYLPNSPRFAGYIHSGIARGGVGG